MMIENITSPFDLIKNLSHINYVAGKSLAVPLFLALKRNRPLFVEGEAGVGKTELAKAMARLCNRHLIRLQCYEGLDIYQAAYEWNYSKQLLSIQHKTEGLDNLFSLDFLIERPLLQALMPHENGAPILLIDELDRADEAFEAFLLEMLSDWQITIPEIGTIKAEEPPIVIITSNRTREVHDALKRRCFYNWVDYPELTTEIDILKRKVPQAAQNLRDEVVAFVQKLREKNLFKSPGVAESIDWAHALVELNCVALDPQTIDSTLGVLLKYQDDISRIHGSEAAQILSEIQTSILSSEIKNA